MKKFVKILISIIVFISILFIIDVIFIFNFNKPLLAIKKSNYEYKGIIYDTYLCSEYSVPQIKPKGTKFNCIHVELD